MSDQIQGRINRQGVIRDSFEKELHNLAGWVGERMKKQDAETGVKMAATMRMFYDEAVQPLLDRIEELEMPWHAKLARWGRSMLARFSRRRERRPAEPTSPALVTSETES